MHRLVRSIWLLAFAGLLAQAQPAPDAPLPFDPAVRQGTLENGLQYYIRANTEPAGRAELRLAVDAGSLLEADDQRGLAHFVEHMAFNGTERFDEPELVRYLESVGTRFGPDLNAYTSFDETVYMLQVPTDSAAIFTTGLDVLREWAGRVTLADSAIERERGVVLEEWRRGRGANERMNRVQFPILYADSRYAERLPIGLPEVIEGAPADRLRAFYRDWYRPDLMAVVVVGDVDVDAVEAQIRERFASLEGPADAPARPTFEVPIQPGTRYAIASDPETAQILVRLLYQRPADRTETVADARADLVESLFYGVLRERIDEIRQQPDAPFAFAFAGAGNAVRTLDQTSFLALVSPDKAVDAIGALATVAERARRFGVTAGELERQKAQVLRAAQSAVAEAENQPSRNLAQAYVGAFLDDGAVPSPEQALEMTEAFLPTITLEEVNAVAAQLAAEDGRVVAVGTVEQEGVPVPTEAELAAVLAAVAEANLEPYEDAVDDRPLVAEMPTPGTVEEIELDLELGTTTYTLSNGVTVVIKPTDFKADEVLLTATSPGGTSLLDADELSVKGSGAGYVAQSGVGVFDQVALDKKLAGQIVSVRPTVSGDTEGFTGRAAPADLETLFQLVYLYATAPRKDADAFAASQNQTRAFLANQANEPRVAFSDTLSATLANGDPRSRTLTEFLAGLDRADLDEAFAFYQDRFADLSDFTFVLVGAVDPEAVRPLVETYLGGLPGGGREEEAREFDVPPPTGVVEKTVRRGIEPQAQVAIVFHGELDADDAMTRTRFNAMADVLSKTLREDLREDRGGVYGVGVRPSIDRDAGRYQLTVTFGTDPERTEELVEAVFADVEKLKAGGALPEHLAAYQEQQRRAKETNLQENRYWLSVLEAAAERDETAAEILATADLAADVTLDDVAAMARQTLDPAQYVRVTLLPEAGAAPAEGGTE